MRYKEKLTTLQCRIIKARWLNKGSTNSELAKLLRVSERVVKKAKQSLQSAQLVALQERAMIASLELSYYALNGTEAEIEVATNKARGAKALAKFFEVNLKRG